MWPACFTGMILSHRVARAWGIFLQPTVRLGYPIACIIAVSRGNTRRVLTGKTASCTKRESWCSTYGPSAPPAFFSATLPPWVGVSLHLLLRLVSSMACMIEVSRHNTMLLFAAKMLCCNKRSAWCSRYDPPALPACFPPTETPWVGASGHQTLRLGVPDGLHSSCELAQHNASVNRANGALQQTFGLKMVQM